MGYGEYTVVVDDGTTKQTEKIRMGETLKLKAARVVQLEDNKFMLTIRGDISPGIVKIKIYDGASLVHTQTNEITADFGQVFNLKKINESISFVVTDSLGNLIN